MLMNHKKKKQNGPNKYFLYKLIYVDIYWNYIDNTCVCKYSIYTLFAKGLVHVAYVENVSTAVSIFVGIIEQLIFSFVSIFVAITLAQYISIYINICQYKSIYVNICQYMSIYINICQYTCIYQG